MTEPDPLFDGTPGDPDVDRLQLLLAPARTEAQPLPWPSRLPWWRRPASLAVAAALVLGFVGLWLAGGSQERGASTDRDPDPLAVGGASPDAATGEVPDVEPALEPDAPLLPDSDAIASTAPEPLLWPAGEPAVELVTHHEGNIHCPQLSPDGASIAYEVNYPAQRHTELWLADLDDDGFDSGPSLLVPESMDAPSRYGRGKRITHMIGWAPPGSPHRFAYTVNNADGRQQIAIDGWAGLIDEAVNKEPAWDPTSPRFVFTSTRTGNGDLYLWDDGAELRLTFDETHAEIYPSWAPAGDKLVYVRAGKGQSQVMLLDVNLFGSVPLAHFAGKDSTRPSFSPKGDKVAFLSNKGTDSVMKFGLWVVDAKPGSTPRSLGARVRLPSKGAPSWTPDGRGVIAVLDDPDRGDPIAIVPIDGSPPRILQTGTVNNRDPRLLVVDGQWRLVFTSQGREPGDEKAWYRLFTYDIPR